MAPAFSGPALLRKVRADFIDTWQSHYELSRARLPFIRFGLSTDDFLTAFGYGETQVYPSRSEWGSRPNKRPARYLTYEVEQYRWTSAVEWLVRDRTLSNLGSVEKDALNAGKNFGTLFERVFFQQLTAATDAALLPATLLSPDGAPLFSATDGRGDDRYGVSGGNIVSGQLWTSPNGVQSGLYAALERLGSFLDPQGQPSCDDGVLEKGVTYLSSIENAQVIHQAFRQHFVSNSTVTAGATSVSNLVLDAGVPVRLILTPRLTGTTSYVISDYLHGAEGTPLMAEVVSQDRLEYYFDGANDRDYAERGLEGATWEMWFGCAINEPRGAVKITE
jgi:hypothetical protein